MRPDREIDNLRYYDNFFKLYLTGIKKERPGIILDKVKPESDMSLWRSGIRGSTSEVSNQILDQVAIDMNNRWRKRKCAKRMDTRMGLRENCTQV